MRMRLTYSAAVLLIMPKCIPQNLLYNVVLRISETIQRYLNKVEKIRTSDRISNVMILMDIFEKLIEKKCIKCIMCIIS